MGITAKVNDRLGAYMAVRATNFQAAGRAMAESIVATSKVIAPMRTGALRSDSRVETTEAKGGVITYGAVYGDSRVPYARAQEFGTNGIVTFRNYTTPGTGKNYLKRAGDTVVERGIQIFL